MENSGEPGDTPSSPSDPAMIEATFVPCHMPVPGSDAFESRPSPSPLMLTSEMKSQPTALSNPESKTATGAVSL